MALCADIVVLAFVVSATVLCVLFQLFQLCKCKRHDYAQVATYRAISTCKQPLSAVSEAAECLKQIYITSTALTQSECCFHVYEKRPAFKLTTHQIKTANLCKVCARSQAIGTATLRSGKQQL